MRTLLDIRPVPDPSTLVGALARAVPRCSLARLRSTLGYAFAFSLNPDGGDLYQTGAIEWGHYRGALRDLPCDLEVFDVTAAGRAPSTRERNAEVRAQAWRRVRESLIAGVPAIAWGAMTVEQRAGGTGAFEWSLLVGHDDDRQTYTVAHRNCPTTYELGFDAFGYSDPVQWFSVLVVDAADRPAQVLPVLQRAIAYGRGACVGAEDAAKGGLAALELWREAFRAGTANRRAAPGHARFLRDARTAAAEYLREVQDELSGARAALLEVADDYEQVARAAASLADGSAGTPADALSAAIASERRAVERLEAIVAR